MTFMHKLLAAALAAFFIAPAFAQNPGTVPLYSVPLGLGAGKQGFGSVALGNGQLLIGQTSAAPAAATPSGDVTINPSGVTAIGASKVTNSQLATMGANTTKCNATGGTANPTDCNASTMKTNLGLVIGTNVEAWDNDLDCIAALATTGQIKRTGTGTCSAGSVALSDLATGSQDTVIGYFGSTTASAVAMNNCTGALTYSTSTHTFGCNASAGTGTVTSVTCGAGLSGGTFTTTGTCAVSLSNLTNALGSDVALNNISTYFTGPTVAQGTTGVWFASGTVTMLDTAGVAVFNCKLWDGTTVVASARAISTGASNAISLSLSGVFATNTGNINIACRDQTSTAGVMTFNNSGNSKDSTISVFRIQ